MKFIKMTIMLGVLIASPVYPETIIIKNYNCTSPLSPFPDTIKVHVYTHVLTSSNTTVSCTDTWTDNLFVGTAEEVTIVDRAEYVEYDGTPNPKYITCNYIAVSKGNMSGASARPGDHVTCHAGAFWTCECKKD